MFKAHRLLPLFFLYTATTIADTPVAGHDLFISFGPDGDFSARDRVSMDSPALPDLVIDSRLAVNALRFDGMAVDPADHVDAGRIAVPGGTSSAVVEYSGRLGAGRWPYLVWLPGDGWYPDSPRLRHTFRFEAVLPDGFVALTQGRPDEATAGDAWTQAEPQQGIYFVAGPWRRYDAERDGRRAAALLLDDDPSLAGLYLEAALQWMARYADALGEYPYHGFALVENSQQTGWGMPGFTLLGSRVIRLPFILHTSYPHEIAHNWWGNGVFVDASHGNWSEPLTTYLADYLVRESRGAARQYRLDTLIGWHDFAANGSDFPLARFTARHDEATQAVGYGKGMFVFHMLRRQLGDAAFLDGLNRFYRDNRFRHAGFDALREAFEAACDCLLGDFFDQWLERTGAPALTLDDARHANETGDAVTVSISQSGTAPPWRLRVPVRITHADGTATWRQLPLRTERLTVTLPLDARAARVDVDPAFDLFRHLGDDERPLTFSRVFGAERVAVVYADDAHAGAAREAASRRPGWRARAADERVEEPAVIWLGPAPGEASSWHRRRGGLYTIDGADVTLDGETHRLDVGTIVALVDETVLSGGERVLLWLDASPAQAARTVERLSHYARHSYAVFERGERMATRTGQWRGRAAALSKTLDPSAPQAPGRIDRPLF